ITGRNGRAGRISRSTVARLSAHSAARYRSRFYDRKRGEGKSHKQAILALARRRLDVLWALIRDQRHWTAQPPQPGLTGAA
ncbi:IS110 family transposase, partial [Streptomyces californicus]